MRDRLIELLKIKYDHYCDQCGANKDSQYIENLADYLIGNGVILPTLSCGDRVWFIPKGIDEVCEATVIGVEYNYFTYPQEWITVDYISSIVGKHEYKSRIDLTLGKTVFLTKEEAERALAERKGNE